MPIDWHVRWRVNLATDAALTQGLFRAWAEYQALDQRRDARGVPSASATAARVRAW